jgi:hypothetical protein
MFKALGVSLVLLLASVSVSYADESNADRAAQEPQFISTEVVVDPYDLPPPRGDTSRSYSVSTGPDTMDPNGVSPHRQLLPVNES